MRVFSLYSPSTVPAFLGLLFFLTLTGCSYHLHGSMPSVLGDGTKTLKVKEINYPTLDEWLPYALRSTLRDEIGARNLAVWVDSGSSDYEISLTIVSYTSREWTSNHDDAITLFDNQMTLEATIYDSRTNKEVWRSGSLRYSERQEKIGERYGANELITQIIRQLCDKLRNSF